VTRRDEEQDVEAALLRRVEEAAARARELWERSEILADAAAKRRTGEMTARCAWCGRYQLGERWVAVERVALVVRPRDATHGICEDCIADLRRRGLSA
jgi:hypothetical protein